MTKHWGTLGYTGVHWGTLGYAWVRSDTPSVHWGTAQDQARIPGSRVRMGVPGNARLRPCALGHLNCITSCPSGPAPRPAPSTGMYNGERPIGAAKGKQTNTMASCQTPSRPIPRALCYHFTHRRWRAPSRLGRPGTTECEAGQHWQGSGRHRGRRAAIMSRRIDIPLGQCLTGLSFGSDFTLPFRTVQGCRWQESLDRRRLKFSRRRTVLTELGLPCRGFTPPFRVQG